MDSEFLNLNTYRNYPFRENMSLVDVSGGFKLPPGAVVDMVVYGVQPGRQYYLTRVQWYVVVKRLELCFQDDQGDGFGVLNISLALVSDINRPSYEVFKFNSPDNQVVGRAVVNMNVLKDMFIPQLSNVTFNFNIANAALEQGAVVPEEPAVISLRKFGDPVILQGYARIKEGMNVRISRDAEGNALEISAIRGAGAGTVCNDTKICNRLVDIDQDGVNEKLCGGEKAIMTINNQTPNDGCSMYMLGDSCLRIWKYSEQKMIAIHNECSDGCNVASLMDEIRCRICELRVKLGIIPGPCDDVCDGVDFQNQLPEA